MVFGPVRLTINGEVVTEIQHMPHPHATARRRILRWLRW
jgi:hypothetical protein